MNNIIVCGGPRCGSTSLFRYLALHESIVISSKKEINYFIGGDVGKNHFEELQLSASLYNEIFHKTKTGSKTLEASPIYMHPSVANDVAFRISRTLPDCKLIFLLRNPVDRLYSQYQVQSERNNIFNNGSSFKDFIDVCTGSDEVRLFNSTADEDMSLTCEGIEVGKYVDVIKKYLNYFPPENMHIMFLENFNSEPLLEMQKLMLFLGLDASIYINYNFPVENKHVEVRWKYLFRFLCVINITMEPLLNKVPRLKQLARSIHNLINVKATSHSADESKEEICRLLDQYYFKSSQDLKKLLAENWVDVKLPKWLEA